MPVGSPQRRPRATGGGAPAGRAPPATEHACDMRPRAHNLHIVSCRRQRPIGQRSAAAHRPLQPRPFTGVGSQGSVLTEPISLRRSKRASPQDFPVHPRRRPQRGQLRSWSSRPPAPVVLASTRPTLADGLLARGHAVHSSKWLGRGTPIQARLNALVVLASTRSSGPCAHPLEVVLASTRLNLADGLVARGHAAHSSNGWAVQHPISRRGPSPRHTSGQSASATIDDGAARPALAADQCNAIVPAAIWPEPRAEEQSPARKPQAPRPSSSPIAKSSRAPHQCKGRSAMRAAAERAKPLRDRGQHDHRVERRHHAAMRSNEDKGKIRNIQRRQSRRISDVPYAAHGA